MSSEDADEHWQNEWRCSWKRPQEWRCSWKWSIGCWERTWPSQGHVEEAVAKEPSPWKMLLDLADVPGLHRSFELDREVLGSRPGLPLPLVCPPHGWNQAGKANRDCEAQLPRDGGCTMRSCRNLVLTNTSDNEFDVLLGKANMRLPFFNGFNRLEMGDGTRDSRSVLCVSETCTCCARDGCTSGACMAGGGDGAGGRNTGRLHRGEDVQKFGVVGLRF